MKIFQSGDTEFLKEMKEVFERVEMPAPKRAQSKFRDLYLVGGKDEQPLHVFTNPAISMDGKISTAHENSSPWATPRSSHDGCASSIPRRALGRQPCAALKAATLRSLRGNGQHPINVILTSNPDFNPRWPFFKQRHMTRILLVPRTVPAARLKPFMKSCEILRYRSLATFPEELIAHLERRGCESLLLEGGGGTIFPFVKKDLVDEWNVTVTPKIVGGADAPTMVDGEGFRARDIKRYRLKKCLKRGDELYLQYLRR